jgi:aquaporin PIP
MGGIIIAPELRGMALIRALAGEYIASLLFLFISLGTVLSQNGDVIDNPSPVDLRITRTSIALAFGFAIFILVAAVGHISGGHINPAVTLGLFVAGKTSLVEAVLYMIFQVLGGLTGTAFLKAIFDDVSGACNGFGDPFSSGEAFFLEAVLTFVLVFTVFAVIDPSNKDQTTTPALAIGMAVMVAHLVAITVTGTGINPMRSFAPAVVAEEGCWDDHWVFWIGPFVGAIVAAIFYEYFLDSNEVEDETMRESFRETGKKPAGQNAGTSLTPV